MHDLQDIILNQTRNATDRFSVLYKIYNSLLLSILFTLIIYYMNFTINIFNVIVIILISIYVTLKRIKSVRKRNLSKITSQIDFLNNNKKEIDLYIPIFNRIGNRLILRNACLFIQDNNLYLAAFELKNGILIKDAAITKKGKKFDIKNYTINKTNEYIICNGSLLENEYHFSMINNKNLIKILNLKELL